MTLQFGVELELLLGGRKKSFASWKSLADDVSKRLSKAGIRNHVSYGGGKSKTAETYHEWSIVQEVTIPTQSAGDNMLYGIELVSPVYPAAWSWAADIAAIYGVVQSSYVVVPSVHCSTHVHISTASGPLSGMGAVLLGEAVLYYEQALDALMPPGRRDSTTYWCRSNRESHMFKVYEEVEGALVLAQDNYPKNKMVSLSTCLGVVRYGYDTSAFAMPEAVNLLPADCPYGRAHGKKRSFVHGKVFKWNFSGLPYEGSPASNLGTVEFRQPPGSVVADEACAWVTLALSFVAGVLAGDGGMAGVSVQRGGASLEELWQVLQTGSLELGWEGGLGAVDDLFRGSSSGSDN
ncbi:hypothetical protein F503_02550 [Ophiostoma piceae UAMH 11346]|uniref:Uncharacterized protein n=1 Tax=Ophiostoma piceae (strain UAMH 11346) TaxID=1262450 RepID=S3C106_OPHP1|nr:hypothetical protein F503_02550 [Ophiostoma piceae UAMH 11346]